MKKLLFRLVEPRAIILGFTVFYFNWALTMWIRDEYWGHHRHIFVATLLLISAACLTVNGGLSNLVAAVFSGWLPLGFFAEFWMLSSHAEVIPLSFEHFNAWFRNLSRVDSAPFLWLTVSTAILCYSLVSTTKTLRHEIKSTNQ